MAEHYPPLEARPLSDTICLFDVDKTLSPARGKASDEMLKTLSALRQKCAIGFVGGSNMPKQQEQLATSSVPVTTMFDFCFAENGLTAYRLGEALPSNSFIQWLGQEKYQKLAKWLLKYIASIEGLPKMTGTFIEFRTGMINVSPVGRNANKEERDEFEAWDLKNGCRATLIQELKKAFPDIGLVYSIGGQISFDAFPHGWDKTYCLKHIENEKNLSGADYKNIHFFGDKTFKGGNDYEIYEDSRTIGHTVMDPDDCLKQIKELFKI